MEKELQEIVEKKRLKEEGGERSVIKTIFSKEFLLPFVKIGILMSLSQWAGINILSSYLVTVFEVQASIITADCTSETTDISIYNFADRLPTGGWIQPRPLPGPDHGLRYPARAQHPLLLRAQVHLHQCLDFFDQGSPLGNHFSLLVLQQSASGKQPWPPTII